VHWNKLVSMWWPEDKISPNIAYACRTRRLKWVPSALAYSWVTLSPGVTNTEAWFSRLGIGHGVDSHTPSKSCCQEIQGRLWPIKGRHAKDGDDDEINWIQFINSLYVYLAF
jgi:hypothetical protein